eukprot:GHVR01019562.1.p1 GENE.GHVR01019562.1~~GHVR01019562.1.p1  ORF type:complete len:236 (-),score=36.42 GHVR01019562.1:438-1145(-)
MSLNGCIADVKPCDVACGVYDAAGGENFNCVILDNGAVKCFDYADSFTKKRRVHLDDMMKQFNGVTTSGLSPYRIFVSASHVCLLYIHSGKCCHIKCYLEEKSFLSVEMGENIQKNVFIKGKFSQETKFSFLRNLPLPSIAINENSITFIDDRICSAYLHLGTMVHDQVLISSGMTPLGLVAGVRHTCFFYFFFPPPPSPLHLSDSEYKVRLRKYNKEYIPPPLTHTNQYYIAGV